MREINLLNLYPQTIRPIEERGSHILIGEGKDNTSIILEQKMLSIARKFGKEYFDGDRLYGYGGYFYDPKFWTGTVKRFKSFYKLTKKSSLLDVGCAKGFLLYDFTRLIPGIKVAGLDISGYAKEHAKPGIQPLITVGNAKDLPYQDKSFDLVISINTIDHLALEECKIALKEIQRVSRKNSFVCVNAWRNAREKERLRKWNITAKTCMSVKDWKKIFKEVGYKGDYWWFTAT